MVSIFLIGTMASLQMVHSGEDLPDSTTRIDVDSAHYPVYSDRVHDGVNLHNKVHAVTSRVTAVTSVAEATGNFGWPDWPDPGQYFMANFDGKEYIDDDYHCLEHYNFLSKHTELPTYPQMGQENFSFKIEGYTREAAFAAIVGPYVAKRAEARPSSAVDSISNHTNSTGLIQDIMSTALHPLPFLPVFFSYFLCLML